MAGRVAIVGAGPSGLAQLQAFAAAEAQGVEIPDLTCFEKQDDWGGLWNYTWRSGTDEWGDPCHGSMYRYLWSNGPKECLEFADYSFEEHFGAPIPSFPPRAVLADYIVGRARRSGMQRRIRFHTAVRWIRYDGDRFQVTAEDVWGGGTYTEEFEHVIVATGHFSAPNIPEYPGFDGFPGRILHSHDFRDASAFAGCDVLVVGGSYSAEDIALQTRKYGASSVTISYRSRPMGFGWPDGIEERPQLETVQGRTVHFSDGTSRDVDAIILCTGYWHHFPFIDPELRLRTYNVLYPPDLYKGVFWTGNPNMIYLGMQDQFYTFTLFDAEAWYARDYILGRITLPGYDEMESDIAAWRAREDSLTGPSEKIDFQADHMRDLLKDVDYPPFDLDLTRRHFKKWEHDKGESIVAYRDHAFSSPTTGTDAPIHHTPWWEALDDSLPTFLAQS